jgi:hypothetical protein
MNRYYINPRTPCCYLVIDRDTEMICGVHTNKADAEGQRDRLNSQWNPQTRTITLP